MPKATIRPRPAAAPAQTSGFESFAKGALGAVGVLYGIGLIIENVRLNRYGITDFGVIKARYVMVGAVFCLHLLVPAASYKLAAFVYRHDRARLPLPYGLLAAAAAGLACLFFAYVLLAVFLFEDYPLHERGLFSLMLKGPWGAMLAVVYGVAAGVRVYWWWTGGRRPVAWSVIPAIFAGFFLVVAMFVYAENVYPLTGRATGGGELLRVRIAWKGPDPMDMPADVGALVRRIGTAPCYLVHDTDKVFYLSTSISSSFGRVVAVPRESVAAIRDARRDPEWPDSELDPDAMPGETLRQFLDKRRERERSAATVPTR